MSRIELPSALRESLARSLSDYLKSELGLDVRGFDAIFLLDHIAETLGPHFYNQGLHDAQAILKARLDTVTEAIAEIEKPVRP